jgi:hypothetical protein
MKNMQTEIPQALHRQVFIVIILPYRSLHSMAKIKMSPGSYLKMNRLIKK